MQVKCPSCGKVLEWDRANRWRPFCSERCKLIDLGAWFSQEHAIPGEPDAESLMATETEHPDKAH